MPQIVLQKVIADAGVASRRASEEFITAGKVKVNNEIVTKLGTRVDPEKDTVEVSGKVLDRSEEKVYFILNKPKGIVSSASDDRGRETVLDLIDTDKRIVPVGRLDIDTTGLLLLTNDGDLVHKLTHPKFENKKEYEAIVQIPQDWDKETLETVLKKMEKGVKINNNFKTSPAKINIIDQKSNDRFRISVTIHEGHKHQVRQMIDVAGMTSVDLRRVKVGSIELGNLFEGSYRELTNAEVENLKK